jgi:uncharacterized protein YprB with RNaseH-like and TPR domain
VSNAATVLDGAWSGEGSRQFLVVERRYDASHRHGRIPVTGILPRAGGAWLGFTALPGAPQDAGAAPLLFLDLETTGLAGGAGTYAFLVGCAWFEREAFVVRQFLLSAFTAEAVLLAAVEQLASRFGGLVTYNGKSFDVPLLENRLALHRMPGRLPDLPHVDLLHPAHRLWSDPAGEGGCRLVTLESTHCGHERVGDVPGFEIPSRYFDFVRTGDAAPLAAVLEHNRLDLLTLAAMTAQASALLATGARGSSPREQLGTGRLLESAGRAEEAIACFAAAAAHGGGAGVVRAESLRRLALALRRRRQYDGAADAWQALLESPRCPPAYAAEAAEALAVHHEHRRRDPAVAREFAVRSLRHRSGEHGRAALEYRLARLNRKLGPADAGTLEW